MCAAVLSFDIPSRTPDILAKLLIVGEEFTGSIDKIAFRSGDGVELTASAHDMPRERFTAPDGEDLSDHPPVVVDFTWQASG